MMMMMMMMMMIDGDWWWSKRNRLPADDEPISIDTVEQWFLLEWEIGSQGMWESVSIFGYIFIGEEPVYMYLIYQ